MAYEKMKKLAKLVTARLCFQKIHPIGLESDVLPSLLLLHFIKSLFLVKITTIVKRIFEKL